MLAKWIKMFFSKKKPKNKISELIMGYAGNYILEGQDEFEKQQRLYTAISAWNIACLDKMQREKGIKKYLKECKKLNSEYNKKDLKEIQTDIKLLIELKIQKYPDVKVQVFDAQLVEKNGKAYVTVASSDN